MKIKLYHSFFVLAIVLFFISCFSKTNETYDLNIHDTYYVFLVKDFYFFLSIFSLLFGVLYLVFHFFRVSLNKVLSIIHVAGTILFLLILLNGLYVFKINDLPKRYYTVSKYNDFDSNTFFWISIFIILFFQLLFIINIFVSLINKVKSIRTSK